MFRDFDRYTEIREIYVQCPLGGFNFEAIASGQMRIVLHEMFMLPRTTDAGCNNRIVGLALLRPAIPHSALLLLSGRQTVDITLTYNKIQVVILVFLYLGRHTRFAINSKLDICR